MPILDTGVFFIAIALGGFFLFYSLNQARTLAPILRVFSFLMFTMVGMALMGGYEVSSTSTVDFPLDVNGTLTIVPTTATDVLISADKGHTIGWVFFTLGLGASLLFLADWFGIKLPGVTR